MLLTGLTSYHTSYYSQIPPTIYEGELIAIYRLTCNVDSRGVENFVLVTLWNVDTSKIVLERAVTENLLSKVNPICHPVVSERAVYWTSKDQRIIMLNFATMEIATVELLSCVQFNLF